MNFQKNLILLLYFPMVSQGLEMWIYWIWKVFIPSIIVCLGFFRPTREFFTLMETYWRITPEKALYTFFIFRS